MTDKLEQSLDSIINENKKNNRGRPRRRAAVNGARKTAAVTNPVGGVKKTAAKGSKPAAKVAAPTGPAVHGSKISVSNLPHDVSEAQLKDYFHKAIGPVKKVILTYGPNGQSRGIAQIDFFKAETASKAAAELNNLKIDNRPMKVEIILAASQAPAPAAPKSLGDRITQPKSAAREKDKPKPATANKNAAGKGRKPARGKKGGRPKPKTAEELDAEMQDYFAGGEAPNGDANMGNGGAVQPANGDTNMDDEVM